MYLSDREKNYGCAFDFKEISPNGGGALENSLPPDQPTAKNLVGSKLLAERNLGKRN
jgi:hypothetical protein